MSEINLNRERGKIVMPFQPTWRFSTPVFYAGKVVGVVVVNIDVSVLLESISRSTPEDATAYLVNSTGDFLLHPDSHKMFAFEFSKPYRIDAEPALLNAIEQTASQVDYLNEQDYNLTTISTYAFDKSDLSRTLTFALMSSPVQVKSEIQSAFLQSVLITFIAIFIGSIIFALLVKKLIKPLHDIALSAANISLTTSELTTLPHNEREDEVGQLSKAINSMITRNAQQQYDIIEREKQLYTITQTIKEGIVITNQQGDIIFANPGISHMFGFSLEELLGKSILMLMPESIAAVHHDYMMDFVKNKESKIEGTSRQVTGKRKSNEQFPLDISVTHFMVEQEMFFTGVLRDITDRIAIEKERQEAHNFLNSVIESLPLALFIKEAKRLRYVSINRSAELLFGTSRDEFIGKDDYDIFNKEEADFFTSKDRQVINSRQVIDIPVEQVSTPSGLRYVHTRKVAIYDELEGAKYLLGMSIDITEKIAAEKELAKVNSQLIEANETLENRVKVRTHELEQVAKQLQEEVDTRRAAQEQLMLSDAVIRNTSEAVIITETDGTIIDVNKAYSVITGFEREEVIGKNPRIAKSNHHDDAFYKSMWQQIIATGSWQGEIWDRKSSGETYPKWLTINLVKSRDGLTDKYVGIFSDMTERKAAEDKLEYMALYDPLTNLPNRSLFNDRLQQQMLVCKRRNTSFSMMFLDLDHFKDINDTLGHLVGDNLLVEVANRLKGCVRESDSLTIQKVLSDDDSMVARMGGDEFTIILKNDLDINQITDIAARVLEIFDSPIVLEEKQLFVQASIGIVSFPQDGTNAEDLVKNADAAMYRAKADGRRRYAFYTKEMNAKAHRRIELEADLRSALENNRFELFYQPKINSISDKVSGAEALVRWKATDGRYISPADFIPVAEDIGLIIPLGEWILKQACSQMATCASKG